LAVGCAAPATIAEPLPATATDWSPPPRSSSETGFGSASVAITAAVQRRRLRPGAGAGGPGEHDRRADVRLPERDRGAVRGDRDVSPRKSGTAGAGAGSGFLFAAETVRASTVADDADDAGSVSSLKDLVH
jgi:hypothetical protein